jgi:hypothetical protein
LRLSLLSLVFVALNGVTTQAPGQASESLGRPVTLPDARCESSTRQRPDSTVTPIRDAEIPPRLLSFVSPTLPTAVKRAGATTVLELVVDSTGRLDPCDVRVVEETVPAWTDAVLRALRKARYSPAQSYASTWQFVSVRRSRLTADDSISWCACA